MLKREVSVRKTEQDAAEAIGVQAYKYGLPLLDMNRIFSIFTSVNVCNTAHGFGPVNQLATAERAEPWCVRNRKDQSRYPLANVPQAGDRSAMHIHDQGDRVYGPARGFGPPAMTNPPLAGDHGR